MQVWFYNKTLLFIVCLLIIVDNLKSLFRSILIIDCGISGFLAIQQYSETATEGWTTSLRFIRSGAAAMPADLALRMEETFKCPLILTYSMTEQMPITQPPTGFSIPQHKPNSVGQPVAASICIVDEYFRPIPYDDTGVNNGEICISGPMVLEEYTANPVANASAYFYLGGMKWFRTGDVVSGSSRHMFQVNILITEFSLFCLLTPWLLYNNIGSSR